MTGCSPSVRRWTVLQRWPCYPALPCPFCQTRCGLPYAWLDNSLVPMNLADFSDFMVFLQNIPRQWTSQVHAKPSAAGWSPFGGALSRNSQVPSDGDHRYLLGYRRRATLPANPWLLMNRKTGNDANEKCSIALPSVKPPCWKS